MLRLDFGLTSGEGHRFHIASCRLVKLAIGVGIVERVIEGKVEVRLDLLFLLRGSTLGCQALL